MMDFLRRLAPATAGGRGRAVLVVPPRDVLPTPLRAPGPVRPDPGDIDAVDDESPPRRAGRDRDDEPQPLPRDRTPFDGTPLRRSAAAAPDPIGDRPASIRHASRTPSEVGLPQPPPARGPANGAVTVKREADGQATVPASLRRPDAPASLRHGASPVRVRERLAPVSSAALAATRAPVHAPAVVHVTIDRIDLRLPATTPPPQPRRVRPIQNDSLTLADYLRGKGNDAARSPR